MTAPKMVSTTARMATYQRVRRTRTLPSAPLRRGGRSLGRGFLIVCALSGVGGVAQAIARTTYRFDEFYREWVVYLAAEAAHAYVHDVGGTLKVVAPDVGFDHVARDEAIGVAHEVFKEGVLSRRQLDGHAFARHEVA